MLELVNLWEIKGKEIKMLTKLDCQNCEEMSKFKKYKRTKMPFDSSLYRIIVEMRPYIEGENLYSIRLSKSDYPRQDMGMIARNPKNHKDRWYVTRKYFEENFEEI